MEFAFWSRVEGTMSRVEGAMSRVQKYFKIIIKLFLKRKTNLKIIQNQL